MCAGKRQYNTPNWYERSAAHVIGANPAPERHIPRIIL
jgi:hypothetical protein